jgi:hypothetical protein
MNDAVNVEDLVFHSSPDPKLFRKTVNIKSISFDSNLGVGFEIEPDNWPNYVPPTWQGPITCTLWAGFYVDNLPHVAGFMQYWRGRQWSGAPIMGVDVASGKLQWNVNWAYDNRWAPLNHYVPVAGNKMIFFLTAGNARKGSAGAEPDITSVAERSNIVMIDIPPANENKVFTFDGVIEPPKPPPVTPPANESELKKLTDALKEQTKVFTDLIIVVSDLVSYVNNTHAAVLGVTSTVNEVKQRQDNTIEGRALGMNVVLRRTDKV